MTLVPITARARAVSMASTRAVTPNRTALRPAVGPKAAAPSSVAFTTGLFRTS